MTERELSDHCRDLVESIGTRETSPTFITERNIKTDEFRDSDNRRKFAVKKERSEEKRLVNADCILLETILVEEGKVLAPYDKLHDFGVDTYRIDNKDLQSAYYYPKMANIKWMKNGTESGDLTHFMFTRMYRPIEGKPLEAGDKVKFDFLKLVNAKFVLDNLEDYRKKDGSIVKRFCVL
jgi:hypothetical protein